MAVGTEKFIEMIKNKLGIKAIGRLITKESEVFELRENIEEYTSLRNSNLLKWD